MNYRHLDIILVLLSLGSLLGFLQWGSLMLFALGITFIVSAATVMAIDSLGAAMLKQEVERRKKGREDKDAP